MHPTADTLHEPRGRARGAPGTSVTTLERAPRPRIKRLAVGRPKPTGAFEESCSRSGSHCRSSYSTDGGAYSTTPCPSSGCSYSRFMSGGRRRIKLLGRKDARAGAAAISQTPASARLGPPGTGRPTCRTNATLDHKFSEPGALLSSTESLKFSGAIPEHWPLVRALPPEYGGALRQNGAGQERMLARVTIGFASPA